MRCRCSPKCWSRGLTASVRTLCRHSISDTRHSNRESGATSRSSWFVLPPAEEFYYRRVHAGYQVLPPLRSDCQGTREATRAQLALLYPEPNARVLIPRELDGSRGRTVFEAVARRREATVYWHLDGQYLGQTHTFHRQSLDVDPGEHILTLVDDEGERVARRFQVLATHQ